MFEHGIIMRAVGDRMIIAPPLVTTREQIDEMTSKVKAALDDTLAELRRRGIAG
jgi:putrescine aminotransferase